MKTLNMVPLAVVAALVLAGCTTTFRPWKMSDIKPGMNEADVQLVLGAPDKVTNDQGVEYMHYYYSAGYNPPMTADTAIESDATRKMRDEQIKQGLKQSHYVVELKNGRVIKYEELTD